MESSWEDKSAQSRAALDEGDEGIWWMGVGEALTQIQVQMQNRKQEHGVLTGAQRNEPFAQFKVQEGNL